jgi:hypothetical protein
MSKDDGSHLPHKGGWANKIEGSSRHRSLIGLTLARSRKWDPSNEPALPINGDQGTTASGVLE